MPTTTPSALLPEDRSPAEDDLHRLVALLDYLASDYAGAVAPGGRILDAGEYAEQQQLAAKLLPLLQAVPPGRAPAATVAAIDADLRAATALLDAKADPTVLRARLTSVRRAVVDGFGLVLSPSSPPSRENGAALYTRACAECHGAEGYPPADKVKALDPPPRTLRDRAVTDGLSPYRVFNAVTYGVEGTAMPDFSALPAHDRWDLAFYVLALAHTPPRGAPASPASGVAPAPLPSSVRTTLAALAATTDGELRDALAPAGEPAAEAALAALRTDVPYRPDAGRAPIAVTRRLLDEALARAAAGDRAGASDLLVDAYLEGFERAEPLLRPRHGALVADIEAGFLALRTAVRNGEPPAALDARAQTLRADLARAEAALSGAGTGGPAFSLLAGAFIMVREGIEAALLVATLLALVGGAGRSPAPAPAPARAPVPAPAPALAPTPAAEPASPALARARRAIHAGWLGALAAGAVTWGAVRAFVGRSGASPELLEGVVSLLAAAVLFYVSYWLLAKVESQKWLGFIRTRILGGVGAGKLLTLTGVAFLAVYREAFETILFYEALLLDRGGAPYVALGAAAGAVVLAVLIAAFLRLGKRLPLRPFFAVSGALLYGLCVVLAGHGLQALRAAGVLASYPVAVPTVSWLGLYADAVGLALQGALVLAIAVAFAASRVRARRDAAHSAAATTRTAAAWLALAAGAAALVAAPAPARAADAAESLRSVLPAAEIETLLADRDLLAEVVALFAPGDPAPRARAAAALAARADARAAGPLAAALRDADPSVRLAATDALGRFPLDAVRDALAARARDERETTGVRRAALGALAAHADAASGEALLALRDDRHLDRALRETASTLLAEAYPELAARAPTGPGRRAGLGLMLPASGALGAYALAAVGALSPSPVLGVAVGIPAGALIGLGTAYLLTRGRDVSVGDAFWLMHSGWLGVYAGIMLGALFTPESADPELYDRIVVAAGLGGEAAGLMATFLLRHEHPYDAADVGLMNLGAASGAAVGLGATLLALEGAGIRDIYLGTTFGGSVALYSAAALLTRDLHFGGGDIALAALATVEGGWLGAWLPTAFTGDPTFERTVGGILLGAGASFALAVAAGQFVDLRPRTVGMSFLLSVYGAFLGASVPLFVRGGLLQQAAASMLAGSVAGAAIGIMTGDAIRLRGGDASFLALGSAWGLWQGFGFAVYADLVSVGGLEDHQIVASTFLGLAAGGLLGLAGANLLPLSPWDAVALGAGAGWAVWFAAWGGAFLQARPDQTLLAALVAGDGGLAATAVLLLPLLHVNPLAIGVASAGGLAGAGLGSVIGLFVVGDRDARTLIGFDLAGTAAGLVGGAILSAFLHLPYPERTARRAESAPAGAGPASSPVPAPSAGGGVSFPVPILSLAPSPFGRAAGAGGRRDTLVTATIVF